MTAKALKGLHFFKGLQNKQKTQIRKIYNGLLPFREVIKTINNSSESAMDNILDATGLVESGSEVVEKTIGLLDFEGALDHGAHDAHTHIAAEHTETGLHGLGIGLSFIKFISTPISYLIAWVKGEEVKDKLAKNARWAQAGLLLALGVTAFFIPAFSLAFGMGAGFIVIGGGAVSLSDLAMERERLKEELQSIDEEIEKVCRSRQESVFRLNTCYHLIGEAVREEDGTRLEKLLDDSEPLLEHLESDNKAIKTLLQKKISLQNKLKQKSGIAVVDRLAAILISVAVIIGITAVLMAAPQIGLPIITAAVSVGFAYTVGRFLPKIVGWLGSFFNSKKSTEEANNESATKDNVYSEDIPYEEEAMLFQSLSQRAEKNNSIDMLDLEPGEDKFATKGIHFFQESDEQIRVEIPSQQLERGDHPQPG